MEEIAVSLGAYTVQLDGPFIPAWWDLVDDAFEVLNVEENGGVWWSDRCIVEWLPVRLPPNVSDVTAPSILQAIERARQAETIPLPGSASCDEYGVCIFALPNGQEVRLALRYLQYLGVRGYRLKAMAQESATSPVSFYTSEGEFRGMVMPVKRRDGISSRPRTRQYRYSDEDDLE